MSSLGEPADRQWFAFAACSLVFLAVLAVSPLKDLFREHRAYQEEYRRILLDQAGSRRDLHEAESLEVRIRQIWVPALGNRVDRCVTCHMGVDNPQMAGRPQPYGAHPETPHTPGDFDRFGCVVCHQGQGRATTVADAHGRTEDWDRPLLPLRYTEASCGRCHVDSKVPEASLLSKGRELLERSGCFGCHKLAGHEGWKRNGPHLDGINQKTYPAWLMEWLRNPSGLRPGSRMPDFKLTGEEIEALAAFLWAQPPKPANFTDREDTPPPGDYDRGKKLFRESRCISCHTVEGRGNGSASELSGIGSKVNRPWLMAFLENPHSFQPGTEMPRYAFSGQDLIDLTSYMMEEFIDVSAPEPGGPFITSRKLVEEGESLYRKYGCAGCHRISGREDAAQIGPELTGIGDKQVGLLDFGVRDDLPRNLTAWLAAKITAPRSFREDLRMPEFDLSEEEVQALVTALLSYTGETLPESYRVHTSRPVYEPPGRFGKLVERYRCLSCHKIQGVGADISTAPLTAEGSKVKRAWLQNYLLVPATIRPLLTDRMVPLRMTEEEAEFMAGFMEEVYVDNGIPGEIFPDGLPSDRADRGRKLFYERYGCQSCHMIENGGGFYGPILDGLGDRLESGWIYWWLQGPQRWRADVRCPDFGLEERDARDLSAFIARISSTGESP